MHGSHPATPRRVAPAALIAMLAMLAAPAPAQDRAENDPAPPMRIGPDTEPIEPTEPRVSKPHPTGLTGGVDWTKVLSRAIENTPEPATLREGTYIIDRPGRLVPAPNDRVIFVPDHAQRAPGEGPMLLLPCATLERLEMLRTGDQRVALTGEVFTAHDRAHLLIVDFEIAPEPPQPPEPADDAAPQPEGEADAPPADDASAGADPEVAALLDELGAVGEDADRRREIERLDAPRGRGTDDEPRLASRPPRLAPGYREGTILVRRAARMHRADDGAWSVVFDNDDPDARDTVELTLLPCRLMESMTRAATARGPETPMTVSGRVYVHDRRGYLLPTFVQYDQSDEIQPRQ